MGGGEETVLHCRTKIERSIIHLNALAHSNCICRILIGS